MPRVLPRELTDILVCPTSKQPLIYFPRGEDDRDEAAGFLLAPSSRRTYRIQEGVPVLLADEASEVTSAEAERLVQRAKDLKLPGA